MRKYLFIIVTAILVNCGCSINNDISQLSNKLVTKERMDKASVYESSEPSNKDIITYLIKKINIRKKGIIGFPPALTDSYIPPVHFDNCVGIRYAYMIEHLLSNSDNPKIYRTGVIVRLKDYNNIDGGKRMVKSLSYRDMNEIKKLYKKWWDKNSHLSYSELQAKWKDTDWRALSGSAYLWY